MRLLIFIFMLLSNIYSNNLLQEYRSIQFKNDEKAKIIILDTEMNIKNIIPLNNNDNKITIELPDKYKYLITVIQKPKNNSLSDIENLLKNDQVRDLSVYESRHKRNKFVGGILGFEPYKFNYILPANISSNKESNQNKNIEAKFQISIKKLLINDLLTKNLDLYISYTQQSFWSVYDSKNSRPFRESNYEPSIFATYPIDKYPLFFDKLAFGYIHQSNGGGIDNSRSWDRIFLQGLYSHNNFVFSLKTWYRIPENRKKDDNPDITDYLGYGEISLGYLFDNKHAISLSLRNNLKSPNRGSILIDYSYPLYKNLYLYIQYFNGYGESLIDYNNSTNKIGIGFLFSR